MVGASACASPPPALPALLAQLVKLSIVPKRIGRDGRRDAFNLKPAGSGPSSRAGGVGVAVTLVRNDKYWGTRPVPHRGVPPCPTPRRAYNLQAGTSDLAVAQL